MTPHGLLGRGPPRWYSSRSPIAPRVPFADTFRGLRPPAAEKEDRTMPQIVDLSQRIHTGMPAWAEMGGAFGLARSIVAVWEDYEDTAYLRTHGAVDRLYRTCHVVM